MQLLVVGSLALPIAGLRPRLRWVVSRPRRPVGHPSADSLFSFCVSAVEADTQAIGGSQALAEAVEAGSGNRDMVLFYLD